MGGIQFNKQEQGLILYRPPPLPPGWPSEVVETWKANGDAQHDEGRFEEINERELCRLGTDGMDVEDMSMDIE